MEVQKLTRALVSVAVVLLTVLATISGAAAGTRYKVLHSFTHGQDGGFPRGSLTLDRKGNLYGGAGGGGGAGCSGNGCGVVFELEKSGGRWQEKILHEFADGNDGA